MDLILLTKWRVPGTASRPRRWMPRRGVTLRLVTRFGQYHVVGSMREGYSALPQEGPFTGSLLDLHFRVAEYRRMLKKKVKSDQVGDVTNLAAVETKVLLRFRGLVEHLAIVRYADGTLRQPGRMTISVQGSSWQVEVKDPDTCSFIRVVQASLDEALQLANQLVMAEETAWEVDQWAMERAAKKKKK